MEDHEKYEPKGTFVMTIIFLAWFVFLYFGNWYLLSQRWPFH